MTVADAIQQCRSAGHPDTGLVAGLSRQVISRIMMDSPGALVPVQSSLVKPETPNVHLFLQPQAAASLADVAAGRGVALIVISGLRTCVQQLMLYRLFEDHAGVPLAARPGNSNHERGYAVDVEDYGGWEPYFLRRQWAWIGMKDKTHFAYRGAGVRGDLATKGVRALQEILNQHGAQLACDGVWGAATESACLAAPATGWTTASVGGSK